MNDEDRKTIYREYIPERALYESMNLTRDEYIIRRFEQSTGIKFDPSRHEIVEANNAFDDGYDHPLSTFYVVEKKKKKVTPPVDRPRPPRRRPPRGPIYPPIGGGGINPPGNEPVDVPQPPREPIDEFWPQPPVDYVPTPPGNEPGNEPEPPKEPIDRGPEPPVDNGPTSLGNEPGNEPEPPKEPIDRGPEPPVNNGPIPPGNEPGNEPEPPKEPIDRGPEPPVNNGPTPPGNEPGNEPEPPKEPIDRGPEPPVDNGPTPPGNEPGNEPEPPKEPIDKGPTPPGPGNGPQPPEFPTPQLPPFMRNPSEEKREKDRLVQDMLDKYYGNPKKRREYLKRYKRFKSHVVSRSFQYVDQNGLLKVGTYQTIDTTYPEYEEDAQFLQLKEYAARLERLTKATLGDLSSYRMVINNYVRAGCSLGMSEEEAISLLLIEDEEYVVTNNYTYNAHEATHENLKTLGKYGEKVSYIPMSKEKKVSSQFGNVIAALLDSAILVRNYTTAPINRAVGTFVISKIHGMIFNPKNSPAGIYVGQRTHRYEARKIYYQSLYRQKLEEENARRAANNKPLKKSQGLIFTFKPRIQALINYKEGNRAVLNAGAHDIEMAYDEIQQEKARMEQQRAPLVWQINQLLGQIQFLKTKISTNNYGQYTEAQRAKDISYLGRLESDLIGLRQQLRLLDYSGKDIIQTDAISLSTHDMANKENVTRVVTGVKLAGKLALGHFIAKRVKTTKMEPHEEQIPETRVIRTDPTYEVVREGEEIVPYSVDYNNMTIGEIVEKSDIQEVTRVAANSNKVIKANGDDIIRGISFNNGHISVGDEEGLITRGLADAQMVVNPNDRLLDVYAKVLNTVRGTNKWSEAEVIRILNDRSDPLHAQVIRDLQTANVWLSSKPTGTPRGWYRLSDIIKVNEEVVKPIEKVIEIPGEEIIEEGFKTIITEIPTEIIDWRWDAARKMVLLSTLDDLNDYLRRTRDKEEVLGEKSYAFPQRDQEKPKQTKVPPHQRDNKARYGRRHYDYDKYHFEGTREGDRASLYNEAGMGTPGDVVERSRSR